MERRRLLTGLATMGLTVPAIGQEDDAAKAAPAADDLLVFAFGSRSGEIVTPDALTVGSQQVFAFPMDPVTGIVRSANRLNQVVVIRLDPAWLSDQTASRAADGIVAYSGVCTHTGCDIEDFNTEFNRFQCPCHESQFDPADGATVVGGPAPAPLAALPLKLVDGRIVVAGEFIGRVGVQQAGFDSFGF